MPNNVHYSHVTLCCVHSIQQSLISSPLYRQATLESSKKENDFKRNKVFPSERGGGGRCYLLIVSTHKNVWSINLKFKNFGIFLLESFLMRFFVCLAFLKRHLLMP